MTFLCNFRKSTLEFYELRSRGLNKGKLMDGLTLNLLSQLDTKGILKGAVS